ncbi:MAG: aquaporin [Nitratireductor sp.]
MKKFVAEAFGTFVLVLIGCGTAVLAGEHVGQLGIAFAFGLGLIMSAYIIGGISGCHINPAVTVGAWAAGRISKSEGLGYIIGQVIGAILGAFLVLIIAQGSPDYTISQGLGQNGFGSGYLGEYNILAAFIFEFVATLIFVTFIMEVTEDKGLSALAGLLIGLCLVGIHIVGIQITGVSVNPARSIGPALFAGPYALAQLPIFIIAPLLGGLVGGYLSNSRMLSANDSDGAGEKAISNIAAKARDLSSQAGERVKAATGNISGVVSKKKSDAASDAKAEAKTAKPKAAPKKASTTTKAKDAAPKTSGALFEAPSGASDDLKLISGIGPVLEKRLNDFGVTKFSQVAAFSKSDIKTLDDALSFAGRIDRDNWVGQAADLAKK